MSLIHPELPRGLVSFVLASFSNLATLHMGPYKVLMVGGTNVVVEGFSFSLHH